MKFLSSFLLAAASLIPLTSLASSGSPSELSIDEEIGSRSAYLLKDSFSLDVAFPGGGSLTGTSAAGARYFFSDTFAAAISLQFSYDDKNNLSAFGTTVKAMDFMKSRGRTNFYSFAQVSAGQTRIGKSSSDSESSAVASDSEKSETQVSIAGGAGFEVFLLPELSTSAEIGLGANILPSDSMTMSTGTAGIGLHYFLLPE